MRRYLKITLMTVLLPMAAMAAPRVEVLQDNLDHPWSLAFLPDNEGVLITLRGANLNAGSSIKDYRRPFAACRRCGPTARAACWMWFWRRILLSRAGYG